MVGRTERWESSAHCRSCMWIDINGWLNPTKQPQSLGFQTPNAQKRYVNPVEETLEKLVPGYFATSADLPTQNCQSIRTRAGLLPESCSNGEAQLRSQPENDLGMDMHFVHINWWTGIFLWHLNATAEKAAPGSCRCVWRGQTCSHLQSIHTSFQDELL